MPETENCSYNRKAHQLCLALNNIMVLINSLLDAEEIMNRIVVEAARAIGCESARIALRVENQWVLKCLYNLPESLKGTRYSDEELPHAALAMNTMKPVAIDDAYNDDRTNTEIMKAFGIRSVLVLPLIERQCVVGALFFNYRSSISFDQAEIGLCRKSYLCSCHSLAEFPALPGADARQR